MAIKPTCDSCGQELTEFGAILLSPPDEHNKVVKIHLCVRCYETIADTLPDAQSHSSSEA